MTTLMSMEPVNYRRFAPKSSRPTPQDLRSWNLRNSVDESIAIAREFVETPNALISSIILSRRTLIDPFQVRSICRQLSIYGIIEESPPLSARFFLKDRALADQFIKLYNN